MRGEAEGRSKNRRGVTGRSEGAERTFTSTCGAEEEEEEVKGGTVGADGKRGIRIRTTD